MTSLQRPELWHNPPPPKFLPVWIVPNVPRNQLLVFWLLRFWVWGLDARVSASTRYIARTLGISCSTARAAIEGLHAAGAVTPLYDHVLRLDLRSLSSWISLGTPGRIPGSALNDPKLPPLAKIALGFVAIKPRQGQRLSRTNLARRVSSSPHTIRKILRLLLKMSFLTQIKSSYPPFTPRYSLGSASLEEFSPQKPVRATSGPECPISTPPPGDFDPPLGGREYKKSGSGKSTQSDMGTLMQAADAASKRDRDLPSRKRSRPRKASDILKDILPLWPPRK